MVKTWDLANQHAPRHAVRVIQARSAQQGIVAMVVGGISAIVAALCIYAATQPQHERAIPSSTQSAPR